MAMRVNTNIAALNSLRQLARTENNIRTNLERLSSGRRLNTSADGPAAMVISEQMKSQIASIGQAIANSETSVSMLQTAEGALNEVSRILIDLRQLAIHASNEGTNDQKMLQADQSEIDNLLSTLNQISENTQFGTRHLLNGSNTVKGVAVGDGLEFVGASPETKSSPAEGYKINITRVATRPMVFGSRKLMMGDIEKEANFSLVLTEGGKNISLDLNSERDLRAQIDKFIDATGRDVDPMDKKDALKNIQHLIVNRLQEKIDEVGLELEVFIYTPKSFLDNLGQSVGDIWDNLAESLYLQEEGEMVEFQTAPPELKDEALQDTIVIRHKQFGSEPSFTVTSSLEGFFDVDTPANVALNAIPGRDIEGTIGGHPELEAGELALGKGQILTGAPGTTAEGLQVKYSRNTDDVLFQILQKKGISTDGKTVIVENSNDSLVGDDKPGTGAFGDQIAEIDGFVHLTQGSLAFQVGPNQGQQVKISVNDTRPNNLAKGIENESGFQSLSEISVLTEEEARDSIDLIDAAIDEVSFLRAKIGAFQKNALESNLSSLRISKENLTASESQLGDADMAGEMSDFVKNQILLSSGTAMLAQANQIPQTVLQLLGGAAQ